MLFGMGDLIKFSKRPAQPNGPWYQQVDYTVRGQRFRRHSPVMAWLRWLVRPGVMLLAFLVVAYMATQLPGVGPAAQSVVPIRNCAMARQLGLAPARIGEPGYRSHLDADDDGISCEVWR